MIVINQQRLCLVIIFLLLSVTTGQQQQKRTLLTIVFFIDYQDSVLKYHFESVASQFEQEWMISSLHSQTNTQLQIETFHYQSQNQVKLMEKICQYLNSTNYFFAITHFRFQSPSVLHRLLTQIRIPHLSVSSLSNMTLNSYTLHLQPSSHHYSLAIHDLVEHFDWGHEHNKLVFIYERQSSFDLLADVLRMKNNRQPAVILKALSNDVPAATKARSILTELRDKAEPNKKIIVAISQKSLEQFLEEAQKSGIVSTYYHLLFIGIDVSQLNATLIHETGVQMNSLQIVVNTPLDSYRIEQALIKDALEIIKHGLKHFLYDDDELNFNNVPNRQECSWQKVLSTVKNFEFRQTIGEKLLSASKTVKFMGSSGMVDFDQYGVRKSIQLKLLHLNEFGITEVGTWSTTNRLSVNNLGIKQVTKIRKHLQVVTREEKPYVVRRVDPNGTVFFEGYCIDMLNEIAQRLQFNYSIRIATDATYGKEDETGQWSGIIGELARRNADLGIGALTITYPREKVIDFTKPFMTFGITILFRKPLRTKPNLFAFLGPLKVEVWVCMAAAYIGVSLFLFSMARFSPYEWQSPYACRRNSDYLVNRFSITNCFWFTIGSLMKQTIDYSPRSLSTRVLIGSWWFFSLIMIASYTANLAAFLTTKRLKAPIDDMEALARQQEIKYGALKGGSTEQFFRSSKIPLYERMWYYMSSRPEVFPDTTEEGVEWVKNRNYAFLLESATNEYNVQRHCELMQVGGLIESKSYGIGTTHGSPYRDRISSEILQLQESGFLNNLYNKWWKERNLPEVCDDDVDHRKKSFTNELDLKNIGGIFVMLIIGLLCSFVVTSLEFYFKARRRKLLHGESTTIKKLLTHDLHFALCTNCTPSRPKFIRGNSSKRHKYDHRHENFDDIHIQANSVSQFSGQTSPRLGHDRLAIMPMNHSAIPRTTCFS